MKINQGEPLTETIHSVTVGHQFPFSRKLAFPISQAELPAPEIPVMWDD
jgi:hypothetical protein